MVAVIAAAAMAVPVLVVGGFFTSAGDLPAYMVAEWRGNHSSVEGAWSTLGSGVNHVVYAIASYKGRVVIGGSFSAAGLVPTFGIAQWDGQAWATIGTGVMGVNAVSTKVSSILYDEVGDSLVAAGTFSVAGQLSNRGRRSVTNAASWNGNSWQAMYSLSNSVSASIVYKGTIHVAAGSEVYRWNGNSWTYLGSAGFEGPIINAIVEYYNDLVIAGSFQSVNPGFVSTANIARWNGATWSPLAAGTNGQVLSVLFHRGNVVAGGKFTEAGGLLSNYIAQWNGAAWSAVGAGFNYDVLALTPYGEIAPTPTPTGGPPGAFSPWCDFGGAHHAWTITNFCTPFKFCAASHHQTIARSQTLNGTHSTTRPTAPWWRTT